MLKEYDQEQEEEFFSDGSENWMSREFFDDDSSQN